MTEDLTWVPDGVDVERPSIARVYDYLMGGRHNLAADRKVARDIIALEPDTVAIARAQRAFLGRAVRFVVAQGVRQFLDIGSGMPTQQNVHEVAQAAAPGARVLYADVDPVTVAVSNSILAGNPDARMIQGDLRHPDQILGEPETARLLDLAKPIGLVISSVLQYIPDEADPWNIVSVLRDSIAPGSYLVIAHPARRDQEMTASIETTYESQVDARPGFRTRAEIGRFFDDFDLVEPGIVFPAQWRPEGPEPELAVWVLAGVGRRP